MKIVHVIQNIAPHSGGPTAVVVDLSASQASAGHDVTVLSIEPLDAANTEIMLETRWRHARRRPRIVAPGSRSAIGRFCIEHLQALRPDVVHLHGVFHWHLRTCARWARRCGIPCFCSTHGMLHPYALGSKWLKKFVYLRLFGDVVRRTDMLLTLNAEERQNAEARFHPDAVILENGVEPSAFTNFSPLEFRSSQPVLGSQPYALFIGRIHPIKGLDGLIRSFHIARTRGLNHALVCIGPDEGASAEIRSLITSLDLQQHVLLLPACYGPIKHSAIAGCSMFVHRPRYEGFGVAVLEAMAAGRPVITTTRCRLDRAIQDGVLIPAPDTDEGFAEAMLRSAQDSSSEEKARRSAVWVGDNLTWTAIASRLDALYRSRVPAAIP